MKVPFRSVVKSAAVLALLVPAPLARAQVQWENRNPLSHPSARFGHSMTFDSIRGKTILFGGMDAAGNELDETWEWDGNFWTRLTPPASPPPRFRAALSFDADRGRTVLFGGTSIATGLLGDTWEFDGATWVQHFPAAAPAPRAESGMVFDPDRHVTLLFGGNFFGRPFSFFGDTWEWNGATWTEVFPPNMPEGRSAYGMAYDRARQKVVLHGGNGGVALIRIFGDTWEYDGATWTQVNSFASPGIRSHEAMAYDSARGRTVLFGLNNDACCPSDTWEWDGFSWGPAPTLLAPRTLRDHAMAFDDVRNRVVLFGGGDDVDILGETWELYLPPVYVTKVFPGPGSEAGDDLVQIRGGGFTDAADTTVFFGAQIANIVEVSPSLMKVRTPTGNGTVSVIVRNSNGESPPTADFSFVRAEIAARFGNVNVTEGSREDVLFVNGDIGDPETRELSIAVGDPVTIDMASAPSRETSAFVLYLWRGAANDLTLTDLPLGLGRFVFPAPMTGGTPQPFAIWKNVPGHDVQLGTATFPSSPAPSTVFSKPSGVPRPLAFTVQGLLRDDASQIPQGFSVTNAVVVRVK